MISVTFLRSVSSLVLISHFLHIFDNFHNANLDDFFTKILNGINLCICGTAISQRTKDVKVSSCRSSDPASSHIFFWQIEVNYYRYITLGW